MFSVDGFEWDIPCRIDRIAELKASEISGMTLDRNYFNDCLGTWMRYEISVAVPFGMEDAYTTLYEILTAPVDGHTFVLPYNQSEINITGRVEAVKDTNYRLNDQRQYWQGTQFSVIANNPSKYQTLDEVISAGMSPYPHE